MAPGNVSIVSSEPAPVVTVAPSGIKEFTASRITVLPPASVISANPVALITRAS